MMKVFLLLTLLSIAPGNDAVQKKQRINGAGGYLTKQAEFHSDVQVDDAPADEDLFDINRRFPDQQLTHGDIFSLRQGRNSIIDTTLFWPTTTIPVQFGPRLGMLAISGIEDARREYEMRTCFSFPDRTDEEDYLYYQPLSGCWSSVGKMGGQQTISIGNGCEKMATIQHEMMHAIGIYHEQSRTDRDGYISIETQNIDPDLVYNFDKYGYDIVDDRRVPYDFNSVMHYGETAFSNNGGKTILTHDPAFQKVIGQRRTFSEGDVQMINRMYPCADPVRVSYSCNFEDESVCGYVQDTGDNIDWLRYIIGETDGKLISPFIPMFDNTHGQSGTGSFMVLDTSGKQPGQNGIMASMRLKSKVSKQCLEFAYYMDLETGSDAALAVYLGTIDQTNGDVLSSEPLVTISGDHEKYWNTERFNINAPSTYKLIIAAKTSAYQDDVIAIDDITIQDKPCESDYFVINDFSQLLATTTVDDGLYSPLLYTEDGYAFKILFFPHGSSNSADGYVGMYFTVAQGENDDNLQWPMYNRVIQMKVVDQGPDVLTRMSQYSSYMTSSSGGNWDKPTSEVNGAYGYASFMPLSDIMNTRNFLKNDAITISVNVRDMSAYAREHASAFADPQPAEPVLRSGPSAYEHDAKDGDKHVIVVAPRDDNDDDTVSSALVGGVAFACSVGVFVLMSVVIMCINQSHKQAVAAIAIAKNSARDRSGATHFNNLSYETDLCKKI